jgi:hypothetical protein
VNELPAVLEKSVVRIGDALGHAGKTSEVFLAWPRRLWLSAAIIGWNPGTGASLVQVIRARLP